MKQQLKIVDADYRVEDGEVTVRCFGKTPAGENVLMLDREFLPYLYAVPEKDADIEDMRNNLEDAVFDVEGDRVPVRKVEKVTKVDGNQEKEVLKVYSNIPASIPKLKNRLWDRDDVKECREFDIPFYRRYLIDKNIRPTATVEVEGEETESEDFDLGLEVKNVDEAEENETEWEELAFDLEVYEDKVIMASFCSSDFEKVLSTEDIDRDFVEEVDSEKELIQRLVEIVQQRDVDVLTGYNTDEYDFNVLRERAEEYNIELSLGRDGERMKFNRRGRFKGARLKGRMHLDLYAFVEHVISNTLDSETLDLDSVAEELLGENKEDLSWEEMKQSWSEKENLEEFADYALKDAELVHKLADEIVPQIMELSRIIGLTPFDACRLTYGQLTENYLLREARKRNMIAPNRPSNEKRRKRQRKGGYEGGFVYTPEAGLYDEVALLDFASLYPTVMVAHNISPDTLNLEECEESFQLEEFDYSFCQDDQGFFPELVEKLVRDRSEIKQQLAEKTGKELKQLESRSSALKVLANSFYGYLGYSSARWYSRECAEATTYLGRKYIQDAIEKAEEDGFEVVYSDTDSVFMRKDGLEDALDDFLDEVNEELPEFMELELEGLFERAFFTSTDSGEGAKKKYAMKKRSGEFKITGFEYVRRDWSPIAKETQKKVLELVLNNQIEEAAEVVKETIERLEERKVPVEKLKIYTDLTKPPEEYESTAPHVEAAKKAEKRGDTIKPETTIDYVITRGGGSISDRAELTKYAESYDAEYYIDNQVLPVALRVLKVFGYTEGQLKGEGKQSGLRRFG